MTRPVSTGQPGDPAELRAQRWLVDAENRANRVRRAKDQLAALPRLATPPSYVVARATAASLQDSALLSTSNETAFIAAVAAAKAEYDAL